MKPLAESDPEVNAILKNEYNRQKDGIQLIASENFTSPAVREAVSSYLIHKYSEGYPRARYHCDD
jgi:glycine hydroxymethyltransferase